MRLDSVRGLKGEVVGDVLASLAKPAVVAAMGVSAAPMAQQGLRRTIALGVAPGKRANDFRLAIRVQREELLESDVVQAIRKRARGEADIQHVGRITKRATWEQGRRRPLAIGTSIGHYAITAGTLGCFVQLRDGSVRILSNNHVLADENRGKRGDAVIQPGSYDGGKRGKDTVGALAEFVPLRPSKVNFVDAALATIRKDVNYRPGEIRNIGKLGGVVEILEAVERVEKFGRTTGHTRGRVTAFELDNVVVGYDIGAVRFDNQIEIEGEGNRPFSRGGDSGSLVVSAEGNEAFGLLFAGSETGGTNNRGLTYANPFAVVLRALKARLLT